MVFVTGLLQIFARKSVQKASPPVIIRKKYTTNINKHQDLSKQDIKVEVIGCKKNVALIKLDRPDAYNILEFARILTINRVINEFADDDSIAVILITGNDKVFSIGGDVAEFQHQTYSTFSCKLNDVFEKLNMIAKCEKPIIAAVNGYVCGVAMELMMMCDIIYAGDKTKFYMPEVVIGCTSGGGIQRLVQSVSKTRTMEMVLSPKMVDACEAQQMGIVSRVFPSDKLLQESIKLAECIGRNSPLALKLAKQAVNQAFETSLQAGLKYEKSVFYETLSMLER